MDVMGSDLAADAATAWLAVLPLIEMAALRRRSMMLRPPNGVPAINQFSHWPALTEPSHRAITTPNADTIYSAAWIDLTQGPVTLEVPDPGARYLSVAVLDMATDVNHVIGRRQAGPIGGTYRLIGPHTAARDDRDLTVATPHGWVLARILVDGPADAPAAWQVQNGLSLHGPACPAPLARATRSSPWPAFFAAAASLLESDPPPHRAGMDALDRLRAAGGGGFDKAAFSEADGAEIAAGVEHARAIVQGAHGPESFAGGWAYPRACLAQFGDDLTYRAIVSVAGLGALPCAEAMYLRAAGDDGTGLFHGDGMYRLTLPEPPPVDGFWSLTMYEATPTGHFFLTENPLHRYLIGDRTPGLIVRSDGGLDIWIGRQDPGGTRRANWLPAPATGPFGMILRGYLPRSALLDGDYRLPLIVPV